eukprot:gene27991-34782_t
MVPSDTPTASPTDFVATYLLHRYSFNDGTAGDSISGLNATLMSGARIAGGRVHLNPTLGSYVQMPGNVWTSDVTELSLEMWVTTGTNSNPLSALFQFGLNGGGTWSESLFMNNSGDGGLASSASLQVPTDVITDSVGNLYVSDASGAVRKLAQEISGGVATVDQELALESAGLPDVWGVWSDTQADAMYITCSTFNTIRTIDGTSTLVSEYGIPAGYGLSDNGGAVTSAVFNVPRGVWGDSNGENVYFADTNNNLVRRIDVALKTVTVFAGPSSGGDGSLATSASIGYPLGVRGDTVGNIYLSSSNYAIRMIDATSSIISLAAGSYVSGFAGDNGPATLALINTVYSFNDGTARDSIGGLNATLMLGAVVSGGVVTLDRTLGSYVLMPANVWVGTPTQLTLETWFTTGDNSFGTTRLFDFGQVLRIHNSGQTIHLDCNAVSLSSGGTLTAVVYLNGVVIESGTGSTTIPTSSSGGYLGKSVGFPGDPTMTGTISEFRIWTTAFTAGQVANSLLSGPDSVYSFNDGTARDSIVGLNATLGSSATVADGRVSVDSSANSYVQLPVNVLGGFTSITLEMWYTATAANGDSSSDYIGVWRDESSQDAAVIMASSGATSTFPFSPHLSDVHLVMTILDSGGARTVNLYADGENVLNYVTSNAAVPGSTLGYLGKSFGEQMFS